VGSSFSPYFKPGSVDVDLTLLLMLIPPVSVAATFDASTYDGSLGALIIVSIGLLLIRFGQKRKASAG
jgi:hypothetical protein